MIATMAMRETPNRRMPVLLALVALAFLLSGCARYAVTDYDSGARFADYRTFALQPRDGSDSIQSLDASRIEKAVARELNKRGLEKADSGEADVLLRYAIDDEVRTEARGPTVGFGLATGGRPFGFGVAHSPVRTRDFQEGKVVVEMVDRQDSRVVWKGIAQRNLTETMSPDRRTELINRVVDEMFKNYPPGG